MEKTKSEELIVVKNNPTIIPIPKDSFCDICKTDVRLSGDTLETHLNFEHFFT